VNVLLSLYIVSALSVEQEKKGDVKTAQAAPHHHSHPIILVLAISFGAFIQGITVAIPVVVSLLAFITADVSFVISS
jgi:hypothetical protein